MWDCGIEKTPVLTTGVFVIRVFTGALPLHPTKGSIDPLESHLSVKPLRGITGTNKVQPAPCKKFFCFFSFLRKEVGRGVKPRLII
jgi:hypothetical protein